ncbi:MAG: M42 family metallopeptidase [Pirellulaceae bacterium]|jgi:endoglucanase
MESSAHQYLQDLLQTPRPSGYEQPVQKVVRAYLETSVDVLHSDVHGNLAACIRPDASRRVMFAGHCDQIGMLVTYIDDSGYVYAETIGGWDPQQLIGQRMTIWASGGPVPAVISRKPIHLLTETERKQVVKLTELWLDIGASNDRDAKEQLAVGDPVTLQLGYQDLMNGLANAPGMDNATGLWVVTEALRRAAQGEGEWGIHSVSTVQEEIGLRGAKTAAHRIEPDVAIAVDVTHATDCPTIDKNQRGDIRLGRGPVIFRGPNMNPHVVQRLIDVCLEHTLPFQMAAIGRATPNDANSLQISRDGVAVGLVAIPNRYMHSAVETISLDDLDHAATLLAKFANSLQPDDSFIP